METQQPRRKRSFKYIIRFFQIVFALILVFIISFFVTLAIRASRNNDSLIEEKSVAQNYSETGLIEKYDRLVNIENAVSMQRLKVRRYVVLKDIPRSLQQAVIAVEDKRFYSHNGFDVESIARATAVNLEAGEIEEGASTITQQLVKNIFLTQERSFTRKLEEVLLAINLERHFDKNQILEMYLNTIYFGSNFYGIYDAAQGYFGKEPKELNLAECAMLAGIPNAPSVYSPYVNFNLAKQRQQIVLEAMVKAHFITNYDANKARNTEIILREGVY